MVKPAYTFTPSLAADSIGNQQATGKGYFSFQATDAVPPAFQRTCHCHQDPFGNSYGYSTANQANAASNGYNPTFDLVEHGGSNTISDAESAYHATGLWIKNW